MAEIGLNQQFSIATTSAPSDDRTRVLKHGETFAVFNRYGDIEPFGQREQGLYFEGTRFVSKLEFILGRSRPLLLSSTVKPDNSLFTADYSNLDMSHDHSSIPHGTIHSVRTMFLRKSACYEKFRVVNYGLAVVEIPVFILFEADYADIFEVRGTERTARGVRLDDEVGRDFVLFSYEGADGVLRRTRVTCSPAPQFVGSGQFQFDLRLEPRAEYTFALIVSCEIPPADHALSYDQAWTEASAEFGEFRNESCCVTTGNEQMNDWIMRSQSDVEMMIVGNPEHNYPYAGVPWFNTVFGRDGIITALECLWLDPKIAKGVLEFLAETQATDVNPQTDAEPGKIVHEMRKGEMAALGEVPFARYYGSVDATPLFVVLMDAYYARSNDLALVRKLWPNVEKALAWIEEFGDRDHDGFVEYCRQAKDGLVQQGWKDSSDSVFHADGKLAVGPIALCEVQGYVYAAKRGAARLCAALGQTERAAELNAQAADLQEKFHQAFWIEEMSLYALALDGEKRPCRVRSSNAGQCLFSGIAKPECAKAVADTMLGIDFFSGWGIRTIAAREVRYNPISYHNGSIWPHDNAMIAAGFARYGFKSKAADILSALLDASAFMELCRLPELFCGLHRRTGEGPTLYPVACSPQAWAAASVFLLLQACLGLSVDAANQRVRFDEPYLPREISRLTIRNLAVGDANVEVLLEKQDYLVLVHTVDRSGPIEVIVT